MDHARTLVASYCFPPYSDTAGIVAAKRVRESGEPVDVVCNAMDSIRQRDVSLTQIGGDLVRRFAAVPSLSAFATWESIRQYVDLGYRTVLRWQRDQAPYEKLYSRAQFAASHFLAARYKASHPSVSWTAEFSDPLSHDVMGEVRGFQLTEDTLTRSLRDAVEDAGFSMPTELNANEWCEVSVFALADSIVFTNVHQREFMLGACHDPRLAQRALEVSVVSPHPTLPRSFYSLVPTGYAVPHDRVNIGYFGNFYGNRGVDVVLNALQQLPEDVLARLCLHVFTSRPGELASVVSGTPIETVVKVNPYVGYLEFLALTDVMDMLLVNDAVTPSGGSVNPFLPSKWSDYKGSTSPVWAIVEEGSTLDTQPGIAYRTPVEHMTGIQQVLVRLARERTRHDRSALLP